MLCICFKQCQRFFFQVQVWFPLYFTIILCLGVWSKATRNLKSRNEVQSKQQTRVKLPHTGLFLAQKRHSGCKNTVSLQMLYFLSQWLVKGLPIRTALEPRSYSWLQKEFQRRPSPFKIKTEFLLPTEKLCFLWNVTCRKSVMVLQKSQWNVLCPLWGSSPTHSLSFSLPCHQKNMYFKALILSGKFWHISIRWVRPLHHFHCRLALRHLAALLTSW